MTEVRIRHAADEIGVHLCEVDFADVNTVIPGLRSWGISGDFPELTAQFRVDDTCAYFEVVIEDDD